jgi:hypothetical protein
VRVKQRGQGGALIVSDRLPLVDGIRKQLP